LARPGRKKARKNVKDPPVFKNTETETVKPPPPRKARL